MTNSILDKTKNNLLSFSVFGAVLASAGLPIYMFGPIFFAETYGVSLTSLGAALFALRLVDSIQDPILGYISARLVSKRSLYVTGSVLLLCLAMVMMFAIPPLFSPLYWFFLTSLCLFTAYSFLSINFYAIGVLKAEDLNGGHKRLAAWRETGSLIGICLAAIIPTIASRFTGNPYTFFSMWFVIISLVGWFLMRGEWVKTTENYKLPFYNVLKDHVLKKLIIFGLCNSAPLAVTSSLFLFYVDSVLVLPQYSGILLLTFFISGAIAAPIWAKLAERYGEKLTLIVAMLVSIMCFSFVLLLGSGDLIPFLLICSISGVTVGADLTLVPAIFAGRVAKISANTTHAFGIWSFISKSSLALAAIILLPVLDYYGYKAGSDLNSAESLEKLIVLYAMVPVVLKCIAMLILINTPFGEK